MMRARGFAAGVGFGVIAAWMVASALGVASGATRDQADAAAHTPEGKRCVGHELNLKIDGKEGAPVIPYGPATITGILHCGAVPIRNAQLAVASVGCLAPGVQPIVDTVTTGLDGSFLYDVPPGPSRLLSFSYTSFRDDPGPSVAALATLRVRPQLRLQIQPRVVRNKHMIYWTVGVLGGPFPAQGITLDPQVKEGRKWQTFDQFRVHQEGTSHVYDYRFLKASEPITYAFRVALPATGSGEYPYASGASNAVYVHVDP
ncbi:MAG: hypothetical protein WB709_01660 [Solirubrobacteraceae bacterium]